MTSSLIRRAIVCAGIVALAISLVGQTATAQKPPKAEKLPICTGVGEIAKWNGATWECAPDADTLADLNCVEEGDIAVFSGGQWECESDVGLVDNGDGTVTDHDTGLMWEKKLASTETECSGVQAGRDVHCEQNTYSWTDNGDGDFTNPDGTLYTDFLERLNDLKTPNDGTATPCFAGHCDWRVPTIGELRSILVEPYGVLGPSSPCSVSPCIDGIFGPTQASVYWSSSSFASNPNLAWFVYFADGAVNFVIVKSYDLHARAVRGGR